MTTATATARRRTDIHAPSSVEFDPAAYRLVGVFDAEAGGDRTLAEAYDSLSGDGYRLGGGDACKCGHCGARIRYSALLVRDDHREFIHVGEICLDNRFKSLTKAEFQRLREEARLNRERANYEERIDEYCSKHACLQRLLNGGPDVDASGFLSDVRRKFIRDGRVSDNQIRAVDRVFAGAERRREFESRRRAEQAELAAKGVECPEGRVPVVGEIVSVKEATPVHIGRGRYAGNQYKITVRHGDGWKVYVSLPSCFNGESRSLVGRRVSFDATVTRSTRDRVFGFGSRPTNFKVL